MELLLSQKYKIFLDYEFTQESEWCSACMSPLSIEDSGEKINDPTNAILRHQFSFLHKIVKCQTCKLYFHEQCLPISCTDQKKSTLDCKYDQIECLKCTLLNTVKNRPICSICHQTSGQLVKIFEDVKSQTDNLFYAHLICLSYSPSFVCIDMKEQKFVPLSPVYDNKSETLQKHCAFCSLQIGQIESLFNCQCGNDIHVYCFLKCRAATLDKYATDETTLNILPKLFGNLSKFTINEFEHQIDTTLIERIYINGNQTFVFDQSEGGHDIALNEVKGLQFITRQFLFQTTCGGCNKKNCFYCCGQEIDLNYIMCSICSSWFHNIGECFVDDFPELQSFFNDNKGYINSLLDSNYKELFQNEQKVKKSQGRQKKSKKQNDTEDEFVICKYCRYWGFFTLVNINTFPLLQQLPFFSIKRALELYIEEYNQKEENVQNDNFYKFNKSFGNQNILIDITHAICEYQGLQRVTEEIILFENDVNNLYESDQLNIQNFEIIHSLYESQVRSFYNKNAQQMIDTIFQISDKCINFRNVTELQEQISILKCMQQKYYDPELVCLMNRFIYFLNKLFFHVIIRYWNQQEYQFKVSGKSINKQIHKLQKNTSITSDSILAFIKLKIDQYYDDVNNQSTPVIQNYIKSQQIDEKVLCLIETGKYKNKITFDEYCRIFRNIIKAPFQNPKSFNQIKDFLQYYFQLLQMKKNYDDYFKLFDIYKEGLDFILNNIDCTKKLPVYENLLALKESQFAYLFYDKVFQQIEEISQGFQQEFINKIQMEENNNAPISEFPKKRIKYILKIATKNKLAIPLQVLNYINNNLSELKMEQMLRKGEHLYELEDFYDVKTKLDIKQCNMSIYKQFMDTIQKIEQLKDAIISSLDPDQYTLDELVDITNQFDIKASILRYHDDILENYKKSIQFYQALKCVFPHLKQEENIINNALEQLERVNDFWILNDLVKVNCSNSLIQPIQGIYLAVYQKFKKKLIDNFIGEQEHIPMSLIKGYKIEEDTSNNEICKIMKTAQKVIETAELAVQQFVLRFLFNDVNMAYSDDYILKIEKIFNRVKGFCIDIESLRQQLGLLDQFRINIYVIKNMQWLIEFDENSEETWQIIQQMNNEMEMDVILENMITPKEFYQCVEQKKKKKEIEQKFNICSFFQQLIIDKKIILPSSHQQIQALYASFQKSYNNVITAYQACADINSILQNGIIIEESEYINYLNILQKYPQIFHHEIPLFATVLNEFNINQNKIKQQINEFMSKELQSVLKENHHLQQIKDFVQQQKITNNYLIIITKLLENIANFLQSNGRPLLQIQYEYKNLLSYIKTNYKEGKGRLLQDIKKDYRIMEDLNKKILASQKIDEDQNIFQTWIDEIDDYANNRKERYKTCFNYDTYEHFLTDVNLIQFLIREQYGKYFESCQKYESKMIPPYQIQKNLQERYDQIQNVNNVFQTHFPLSPTIQKYTQLYFIVNFLTQGISQPFIPDIQKYYEEALLQREEFQKFFFNIDDIYMNIVQVISQCQLGEQQFKQFQFQLQEVYQSYVNNKNKKNIKQYENFMLMSKLAIISILLHIIYYHEQPFYLIQFINSDMILNYINQLSDYDERPIKNFNNIKKIICKMIIFYIFSLIYVIVNVIGEKYSENLNESINHKIKCYFREQMQEPQKVFSLAQDVEIQTEEQFYNDNQNSYLQMAIYLIAQINGRYNQLLNCYGQLYYAQMEIKSQNQNKIKQISSSIMKMFLKFDVFISQNHFKNKIIGLCQELATTIVLEQAQNKNIDDMSNDVLQKDNIYGIDFKQIISTNNILYFINELNQGSQIFTLLSQHQFEYYFFINALQKFIKDILEKQKNKAQGNDLIVEQIHDCNIVKLPRMMKNKQIPTSITLEHSNTRYNNNNNFESYNQNVTPDNDINKCLSGGRGKIILSKKNNTIKQLQPLQLQKDQFDHNEQYYKHLLQFNHYNLKQFFQLKSPQLFYDTEQLFINFVTQQNPALFSFLQNWKLIFQLKDIVELADLLTIIQQRLYSQFFKKESEDFLYGCFTNENKHENENFFSNISNQFVYHEIIQQEDQLIHLYFCNIYLFYTFQNFLNISSFISKQTIIDQTYFFFITTDFQGAKKQTPIQTNQNFQLLSKKEYRPKRLNNYEQNEQLKQKYLIAQNFFKPKKVLLK